MFHSFKAYLSSKGGPCVAVLSHDVKRGLADSQIKSGFVTIVSQLATVAVGLGENDPKLAEQFLVHVTERHKVTAAKPVARRSGAGPDVFHSMAASIGLSLTLPFDSGKLLVSPFYDIYMFDFEPQAGRREFSLTYLGDPHEQTKK